MTHVEFEIFNSVPINDIHQVNINTDMAWVTHKMIKTTVPLILLNTNMIIKSENIPGVDYKIQHNGVLEKGYMPFPKNDKLLEEDDASSSYTFPQGVSFTFMGQSYRRA